MSDNIEFDGNKFELELPAGVMVTLGWTPGKVDYKFGELKNLDAADGYLPIWDFVGSDGNTRKRKFIFSTTNDITHVVSSSASDVGKPIIVYGFQKTSEGAWEEVPGQLVILNGQTPVALPTPLFRCPRVFNPGSKAQAYAGEVFVMVGNTVTAGVPDDLGTVRNFIGFDSDTTPRSKGQSQKCIISVPSNKIILVTKVTKNILAESGPTSANVFDIKLRLSYKEGVERQIATDGLSSDATSSAGNPFEFPRYLIPNSDLVVEADCTIDNAAVSYELDFLEFPCTRHNVRGYLREALLSLGYNFDTQRYE